MNTKICPTCHSPIPASAPGGFCPACLLRDADEPPPPGRAAPAVAEIAAAFPSLEVASLIGQGGMGFVYKARQPGLDRTVALKILAPELGRDPAFAERFAREARVLGKLSHPNIVTVFEHGESGGFFYLLMEYVDGVNLRQAMRAGRFSPTQALAVVPGICDALQAAHAQGVWHRDIKPENILLDARGGVKIADFGIARIVGDPARDFTLTATGGVLGSAAYMAPEQHEKPHDVDHRADIYSLGVVLYEMLTGELPLGRFPAPSARAAVGARIDEIVLRTLEKERELRQQSAEEVKTEVAGAATHRGAAPPKNADGPAPLTQWSVGLVVGGLVLALAAAAFTHGSDQGIFLTLAALAFGLGYLGAWVALSRMRHGRISPAWRGGLRSFTWVPLVAAMVFAIAAVPIYYLRGRVVSEQSRAAQSEAQLAQDRYAEMERLRLDPREAETAEQALPPQEPAATIVNTGTPRAVFLPANQAHIVPAGKAEPFAMAAPSFEPQPSIEETFRKLNAMANDPAGLDRVEFRNYMAKQPSGNDLSQSVNKFKGTILKCGPTSREALLVDLQLSDGTTTWREFRFKYGNDRWQFDFDLTPSYRSICRVEFKPPQGKALELLRTYTNAILKPVPGEEGQFDLSSLSGTNDPKSVTDYANQAAGALQTTLAKDNLARFFRVIAPATIPEAPQGAENDFAEGKASLSRGRGQLTMAGEVVKPGRYSIPEGRPFTVSMAIKLAGGITAAGNPDRVQIVRPNVPGTHYFSVKDALEGAQNRREPIVQGWDTITVEPLESPPAPKPENPSPPEDPARE